MPARPVSMSSAAKVLRHIRDQWGSGDFHAGIHKLCIEHPSFKNGGHIASLQIAMYYRWREGLAAKGVTI